MCKEYGYIRVSAKDQNEARQIVTFRGLGIPEKQIYIDKISGKNFDRTNYLRLIRKLRKGDCLFIDAIDRLGRNYSEILEQWRLITKVKQVDIVVLDMDLLDTRQKGKDLTGRFISDLVLQILSYVAEKERINTRRRQAEGIAVALANGVHFGRTKKEIPDNFNEIVGQWRNKELTLDEALQTLSCGRTYFYKTVKELGI
ncbi:MAG: recombinase family protein [Clostridia bacterium]|nr:recombinase family protein [Clostridia bacterium]